MSGKQAAQLPFHPLTLKNLFCLYVNTLCNIANAIFNFQTFCVISQVKVFTDLCPESHYQLSKWYKRICKVIPLWMMIYLIILFLEIVTGSYVCLIVLPNCKEEIPPHACMKLPLSRLFKSGVQGEWSDTTISMWPAFSADHSCSWENRFSTEPISPRTAAWAAWAFSKPYWKMFVNCIYLVIGISDRWAAFELRGTCRYVLRTQAEVVVGCLHGQRSSSLPRSLDLFQWLRGG